MNLAQLAELTQRLRAQVATVVVGHDAVVDALLTALFAGGHVLLEGPPGTAKTLLARAFAASLGLAMNRIQFTPDLMPGDIVGTNLFNFQTNQFTLTRGPIFTDYCSPTRSTARRPRRRPRCCRPCRSAA
jgi:MoxR-like ATPase